jgi:hypothetical protein
MGAPEAPEAPQAPQAPQAPEAGARLSVEALLAGAQARHTVTVPSRVLDPAAAEGSLADGTVVLRPLVLADVQRIAQAARDDAQLTSLLMVAQSLVEPALSVDQVGRLHVGLVEHLLAEVHRVSGLRLTGEEIDEAVQAPLARACFVLARELGWTPDQCAALTVGQVLLQLELLGRTGGGA